MPTPTKRNQDSLEKWLISDLGPKVDKMSLGHLILLENKSQNIMTNKDPRANLKGLLWPKCDCLNNDNVLKDMKHIKIYESILIFQKNPKTS